MAKIPRGERTKVEKNLVGKRPTGERIGVEKTGVEKTCGKRAVGKDLAPTHYQHQSSVFLQEVFKKIFLRSGESYDAKQTKVTNLLIRSSSGEGLAVKIQPIFFSQHFALR